MIETTKITILELQHVLLQLDEKTYTAPCRLITDATVGQHTRHIIELFQCLEKGYVTGTVNYDLRERNKRYETELLTAVRELSRLQRELDIPDKDVKLVSTFNSRVNIIQSNYYRELTYNLEHTIHHAALIRVAIEHLTDLKLPEHFGVAPSTIQHRNSCAQ